MKTQIGSFPGQTGQQVYYHLWTPEQEPKAVVQILHGMAEHAERYTDFANFLCKNGYIVAADDHAGHGKTAKESGKYGFFDEKEGWNKVADDLIRFNQQLKDLYKLPIVILGHSMGSFFARTLMIRHPEMADKWMLSGTGNFLFIERVGGFAIANLSLFFKNPEAPAGFMHKLSFGAYNKKFKAEDNEYAWLSTDKEIVEKYDKDPYCGGIFSGAFYRDLMYGVNYISSSKSLKQIPKGTKVHIFSGEDDPVGNYGVGVKKVYRSFQKLELDVKLTLYPGMRHEILNETNRLQVYEDMLSCIQEVSQK